MLWRRKNLERRSKRSDIFLLGCGPLTTRSSRGRRVPARSGKPTSPGILHVLHLDNHVRLLTQLIYFLSLRYSHYLTKVLSSCRSTPFRPKVGSWWPSTRPATASIHVKFSRKAHRVRRSFLKGLSGALIEYATRSRLPFVRRLGSRLSCNIANAVTEAGRRTCLENRSVPAPTRRSEQTTIAVTKHLIARLHLVVAV